jgi:hypothetical protein
VERKEYILVNIAANINEEKARKLHRHLFEVSQKTGKKFTLKAWIESAIDSIGKRK